MIFPAKRENFSDRLANPEYYLRAIVRLHHKYYGNRVNKIYTPAREGYNLMQAFMDKRRLSRALAHDVSHGLYEFSPARINHILTPDKVRRVVALSLTDQIVNSAIYLMLAPEHISYISPHVHSYLRGRSRVTAIDGFMRHLKEHRHHHPDKKTRGLFVLRTDIKAYGESIPVLPGAPIWEMVRALFIDRFGAEPDEHEWRILTSCIRPNMEDKELHAYSSLKGIPDGVPIAALLLNLYAKPLDDTFAAVAGGYYLRFGDDFLFAHHDYEKFSNAVDRMRTVLAELGLQLSEKKTYQVFFNGAARASHGIKGASYVEYLGCQLHFNGAVGLKNEKIQLFLKDIRERAQATAKAALGETLEYQGALIGNIINQALKPNTLFANPQAVSLKRLVSDRKQLRALDKQIARIILQAVTNNASVKQFRKISYRKIRSEWNVESLEYGRN